jgi:pimeloyl-ACP methyl ester carboxylesterase
MPSHVLYFKSINPSATSTLLLLHGSFSSHHEWDAVYQTPHLSSYHLLIPDLPSHGRSASASVPFNMPDTVALLVDLITKHGKHGKVGLVGMSLGGYISIYLAAKHPELINDMGLFVSGCGRPFPAPGSFMCWGTGFVMFVVAWVTTHLPKFFWEGVTMRTGLQISENLYADIKAAATYRLGHSLSTAMSEDPKSEKNWKDLSESVKARSLVVAGVLIDSEEDCRVRGRELEA